MTRLRHPIRAIREPFGTAGLIVACVALVAALGGTAFAAAKLNSTQKKEVEKIAKKFAGKPGAPGANGTNGASGKDGTKGEPGVPGSPGASGKSVVLGTATTGECPGSNPSGGTTVEIEGNAASKKKICNGKEGSPWTAGGVLPSGKTETGEWVTPSQALTGTKTTAISFPIPLSEPLEGADVHIIPSSGTSTTECPGSVAEPKALSGNLCVYTTQGVVAPEVIAQAATLNEGADRSGALLVLGSANEPQFGTWAVTGE
jgi:hypothetical protein